MLPSFQKPIKGTGIKAEETKCPICIVPYYFVPVKSFPSKAEGSRDKLSWPHFPDGDFTCCSFSGNALPLHLFHRLPAKAFSTTHFKH
ncbi:Alpha-N-acetylgalactosaminide alpha-2,6-sialyltransferase 2 [Manis javanica]|nr:Alpha-N-acetylgalactosaminide alpha-2,6-sialyltransferase 2 [Manis javanica]